MKRLKKLLVFIVFGVIVCSSFIVSKAANQVNADISVNIQELTYEENGVTSAIKTYSLEDFDEFLQSYEEGSLPTVYITEFLFDGVSTVKPYDLDDFIEGGNSTDINALEISALNINKDSSEDSLSVELTGKAKGLMIAVDTNNRKGEINLILNGVDIATGNKKAPAVYVYNKDITYTDCKVTIKTVAGTKNYIKGGKLKKVSLMESNQLSSYSNKYQSNYTYDYTSEDESGNETTTQLKVSDLFSEYTNYYGVYSSSEIDNILFAKVQAENEDLADGDPYYFYKASGAISSDIDLYFEGEGYLEVTSTKQEGIETKANLTFSGGTGDYVIYSQDDCLNTTTGSNVSGARNTLTIDVNSLTAIVDENADEGDAIDSNGQLIINGGKIYAYACPTSQDSGLDSDKGTYINKGTVYATGNMVDEISENSKQAFMYLVFAKQQDAGSVIKVTDESGKELFTFTSDRAFTSIVYSSEDIEDGTYYVYVNGVQQQYTEGGNNFDGQMARPDENQNGEKPEPPENGNQEGFDRPEMPTQNENNQMNFEPMNFGEFSNLSGATSKNFIVSGISNRFNNISEYIENQVTEIVESTNEQIQDNTIVSSTEQEGSDETVELADSNTDENAESEDFDTSSTSPKTGDSMVVYAVLIVMSSIILISIVKYTKKQK
ncbi:MAG: carbohydrate-binding domain-containing protein [Clostridia bacterium]|nr:carbohydrate-binding domain-containing protein [Clostridia bacterium]